MIESLLQIMAPHHCYGCGEIGSTLCPNCKYDIVSEGFSACLVCDRPTSGGICAGCRTTYERAWCVGSRIGSLERLIDAFKFERVKAAHKELAELLDMTVDILPADTVVVSVPTVSSHIRERGYDHTKLIARRFARLRGLTYSPALVRTGTFVQRGASRRLRMQQAERSFHCAVSVSRDAPYLIVDDVVTTNATLRHAAQALKDAGASRVWVAVVACQPLDK